MNYYNYVIGIYPLRASLALKCSNIFYPSMYRRRWLLSVGTYSFCQQENERLTANVLNSEHALNRNTVDYYGRGHYNKREWFGILRVKRLTNIL